MSRSIVPLQLGIFIVCLLGEAWGAPLRAETPKVEQTLLVHPSYDLSQAENRQALVEAGASRIVVPVLSGGETLHPTASTLFRQAERYRDKSDALRSLRTACRDKGIAVFVSLDCLQWVRPGAARDDDVLARHDELAERDTTGGCGSVPVAGKYASPFHPRVRQALVALVEEVVTSDPLSRNLRTTDRRVRCRAASRQPLGRGLHRRGAADTGHAAEGQGRGESHSSVRDDRASSHVRRAWRLVRAAARVGGDHAGLTAIAAAASGAGVAGDGDAGAGVGSVPDEGDGNAEGRVGCLASGQA
jgi:hypothetical protein